MTKPASTTELSGRTGRGATPCFETEVSPTLVLFQAASHQILCRPAPHFDPDVCCGLGRVPAHCAGDLEFKFESEIARPNLSVSERRLRIVLGHISLYPS